jgi:hypothetical protein
MKLYDAVTKQRPMVEREQEAASTVPVKPGRKKSPTSLESKKPWVRGRCVKVCVVHTRKRERRLIRQRLKRMICGYSSCNLYNSCNWRGVCGCLMSRGYGWLVLL